VPTPDGEVSSQIPTQKFIAGFWKRPMAFFIDMQLLSVLGFLLGLALFDIFASLGVWGKFIGFIIALFYFGILNSTKGKGMTIGKRLMNIKVVNRNGQSISLLKSFLRYTILGTPFFFPFFLNGDANPLSGLLTLGILGAIVYLYIFNRETRQSLHDLITGAYVVQASISSRIPVIGVRKIHLIIISIWFLVVLIFSTVIWPQMLKTEPFHSLLAVCKSVQNSGKINGCNINAETIYQPDNKTQHILHVSINWKENLSPSETEAALNEIASIILKNYPNATNQDLLEITVSYGFDIGIASYGRGDGASYSPAVWRQKVQEKLNR
jgi:uncharacterized RDD family membrane protein YckC